MTRTMLHPNGGDSMVADCFRYFALQARTVVDECGKTFGSCPPHPGRPHHHGRQDSAARAAHRVIDTLPTHQTRSHKQHTRMQIQRCGSAAFRRET